MALGVSVPTARAQSSVHSAAPRLFEIPAGPLSGALSAWGAQSGMQLVFPPELIAGKAARKVSGRYPAGEALNRLLGGTGVAWEALNDSTIVLKKAPPPRPPKTTSATSGAATTEEPRTLDRLIVTGSNIPTVDAETASPVQIITRMEIERSGKATVADYLQTLTADGQGSIPKTFGNGFASGGTAISLRGLGASATLILVNGRRMASFGLADDGQRLFTDLGTIPLEIIERIEVLKDGASAIYGSDAIAGVVNIILRKEFTGAVVKGSYGISGDGDGELRKGSIAAGTGNLAGDGYNAFISIEGTQEDAIHVDDRRDRRWIGTGDWRRWGYSLDANAFLSGAIVGRSAQSSPVGAIEPVSGSGRWESLPGCEALSDVTPQDPGGGCLWDSAQFRDISPKTRSINVYARGTFALSDRAELYTEFGYARNKTRSSFSPSNVSGSWGGVNANSGPGATQLGADHPDNPYDVPVRLRYSAFDVGPRVNESDNQAARILIGMKGVAEAWDYDLAYQHSQSDLQVVRTGYLHYDRVRQVLTDPDSPVGYWRIGANSGLNSQALYDYISPQISAHSTTKQDMADAKASRSLLDLKGGSLGLAFGIELRRQSIALTPTSFTEARQIIGLGYSAYSGVEEVAAIYGELQAPLTDSLKLSGAVRVDKYKGYKAIASPKLGIKWQPLPWMALRASYTEGVRAPSPIEAGNGGLASFAAARDPIRCPDGAPAPGAGPDDCELKPIDIFIAPNRDLKPERAKHYSIGAVFDPTPTTSLTLDFFQIRRRNEILVQDFLSELVKNGDNIHRDDNDLPGRPHSGTLQGIDLAYANADSTFVQGFDFSVRQRFELGNSANLMLDLQWTRMNSFERNTGGVKTEYAGTHGDCNVTNCMGIPKDRVNLGATWDKGDWSVSGVVNYRGKLDNTYGRTELFSPDGVTMIRRPSECGSKFSDGSDAPRGCELDSFYTINLSGSWRPSEVFELFGSVQNVTDRIAPLDPLTYGAVGYNPLDYGGAVGRYYTVGVKYAFR
jgi:iron complex outermembrane receptor protein